MEWILTEKESVALIASLFLLGLGFYMLRNPAIAEFMAHRHIWNLKGRDRVYVRNINIWIWIVISAALTGATLYLIINR